MDTLSNTREIIEIDLPQSSVLISAPESMLQLARSIVIDSPEMANEAADEMKKIKAKWNALEEQRTGLTKPALEIQRRTNELFRKPMELLKQAEDVLKRALIGYQRAEQDRLERERRAREEQARLERERAQAEARRQQEEADRLQAEADAAAKKAEEALQAEVKAIEANDHEAQFQAIRAADIATQDQMTAVALQNQAQESAHAAALAVELVAPAAPMHQVTKLAGVSTSRPWKGRITNLATLLHYIADHPEYHDWVSVSMVGLNGLAKAQKGAMQIPGAEAFQDISLSSRSR